MLNYIHIDDPLYSRQNSVMDIKKTWDRPVVRPTCQGSSIAQSDWTDNVRAHADMNNRSPLRDLNKLTAPPKVQSTHKVSTGWIYHTRDIYRCYAQDQIFEFARFDTSRTQRRVNAFNMFGLHSPPNTRFVQLCHIVTPPYSTRRRQSRLMSWKNSSNYDR